MIKCRCALNELNDDNFDLIGNEEDNVIEEIVKKTLECGTHLRLSGTLDEVN